MKIWRYNFFVSFLVKMRSIAVLIKRLDFQYIICDNPPEVTSFISYNSSIVFVLQVVFSLKECTLYRMFLILFILIWKSEQSYKTIVLLSM